MFFMHCASHISDAPAISDVSRELSRLFSLFALILRTILTSVSGDLFYFWGVLVGGLRRL
jgi:hypothetical protein